MTMMAFHVLFPAVAKEESRTITPFQDAVLPNHPFLLMENYCVEPRCDCRRVVLNVVDTVTRAHMATINYGFEPTKPPFDDEPQAFLDPLNPQSDQSPALMELVQRMLVSDAGYRARLERHYAMWKAVVDDPSHPDHQKIRNSNHDDPDFSPAYPRQEPVRKAAPKPQPNAPCPCGSGKKAKRCCHG